MPQVLIIDDDPSIQLVLKKVLKEQGYEVELAFDGAEGLRKARTLQPALIICDWMLPQMNGVEVCRCVKADPDLATVFFILLTSRGAIEDLVFALDNGADDFLSKPVDLNELKARIRAGLRLQKITQDLQTQKRVLETEFNEAVAYVRSLLPPPLMGDVRIESRFVPSRQLGGDCFDYYWLDPDYLAIYLLDVSGHGLGAALLSISVLNILRSQTMDGVNFYQPNHVLHALNEAFQMDSQHDKYFTIWYGVYNKVKRQLIYSSAGHPPAILLSKSSQKTTQVEQLPTASMAIGMLSNTKFFNQRCNIPPLSTLYVFSDGVYETQAGSDNWNLEKFIDLLAADQESINQLGLDYILSYIKAMSTKDILDDDFSLLKISFD